jgi:site-specific recombinase XerD
MSGVPNPSRVRVSGPLAGYAPGVVVRLEELGYRSSSATAKVLLFADLSRWLDRRGLGPGDLDGVRIGEFLAERRARGSNQYSEQALALALSYLRGLGVVPAPTAPTGGSSPVEVLLAGFGSSLRVSPPVVAAYQRYVRPFLAWLADRDGAVDLVGLDARAVAGFLAGDLPGGSAKRAQMTACALRCFLRYVHDAGLVGADLSAAVPAVPSRRAGLPKALTADQVGLLLGACDRSTPVGLRDYAVIVCLARLGLRAGEVGGLALSAVDWPAGVVTVHGKGGRVDQLPIPVDVGAAIVAYLRHGRPGTSSPTVFVRACAPFTPMGASSVSCIVARAAARAGLGTVHAHRLRHTAATATLNAGASLGEVSLLLRHASPATTTVYAKVDLSRLVGIARPWPGAC